MKLAMVRALALQARSTGPDESLDAFVRSPELREAIGLCTYAHDLLQRLRGVAVGPASLALWRSFAWTPQGSPKKGFVLSASDIMVAQQTIVQRLSANGAR